MQTGPKKFLEVTRGSRGKQRQRNAQKLLIRLTCIVDFPRSPGVAFAAEHCTILYVA